MAKRRIVRSETLKGFRSLFRNVLMHVHTSNILVIDGHAHYRKCLAVRRMVNELCRYALNHVVQQG